MTPRRARTYTWLFLGLAGCATVNVMLFQQRLPMRGMGGAYGESAAGGAATRPATAPVPAPSVLTVNRPVKATVTPPPNPAVAQIELLQAVQRELNAAGHYAGLIDGRPTRPLTAAIVAFEYQQGLAIRGEPTDDLLKRVILGSGGAPAARQTHLPGEIIPGSPADHLVRWVIESLNRIGHDAGKPQSKLDLKAIQAIRAFEAGELMPPTGRINEAMVRQLERRLR